MTDIGKRIVVYGATGSGKTTTAIRIANLAGVPCIELDSIFWKPDWVESPVEEFKANVQLALDKCPEGWVCDGNYSNVRDLILPSADTIVWLHLPFRIAFWRVLKRTIARCWDGKLLWGTNRESWRQNFLSKDSLILYQITHWRKYDRIGKNLEEIPHKAVLIELRTQKDVSTFLKSLG